MNDYSTVSTSLRRGLAFLWVARDLSFLGNWIAFVALLAWTYRSMESARTAALLVVAWMLLPILLRPVAEVLVNAGNARVVGAAGQLLRAAALLPLLTVSLNEDVRTVLIVACLVAAPAVFVRTSQAALLPAVVDTERLKGVRRTLFTTRLLAIVAGATASVYLFRVDELRSIAIVVAAVFALSAALMAMIRFGGAAPPATARPSLAAFVFASQRELFRALRHPALQPIVVVHLLLMLAVGGSVVAKVAFVTWGLFMPNENIGFLLAAQGAGLVVAFAGYRYGSRRLQAGTLVAAGLLVAALSEFGFALTNNVPPASIFNFSIGLGSGVALLGLVSMFRAASWTASEEANPGLASGVAMASWIAVLVSAVVIGAVVDAITARFTIVLLSGILTILAMYAFGVLPVLAEKGEESSQAMEGSFSTYLPD